MRKWRGYIQTLMTSGNRVIDGIAFPAANPAWMCSCAWEAAWRDITAADSGNTSVAIVGHSSAMMIFLASTFAHLPAKPVLNTSITTLERYGGDLADQGICRDAAPGSVISITTVNRKQFQYNRRAIAR